MVGTKGSGNTTRFTRTLRYDPHDRVYYFPVGKYGREYLTTYELKTYCHRALRLGGKARIRVRAGRQEW